MERYRGSTHPDAEVESVFAGVVGHVLVGSNTGGLHGLAGKLLLLPTAYPHL